MAKKKLQHFAEMKSFSCVFEPEKELMVSGSSPIKGNWHNDYFGNSRPITLELGCGKGEYTIALAGLYPRRNFIGVDVKGARLWRGSKTAEQSKMPNVAFLRTKIEFIETFFAQGEVSEIWLTFSDPQPRDHKGTKRLSGRSFLERYSRILEPGGRIHVKTDSDFLYERTLSDLKKAGHPIEKHAADIYGIDNHLFSPDEQEILMVKTYYERKFLDMGKRIHYIRFTLNSKVFEDQ